MKQAENERAEHLSAISRQPLEVLSFDDAGIRPSAEKQIWMAELRFWRHQTNAFLAAAKLLEVVTHFER